MTNPRRIEYTLTNKKTVPIYNLHSKYKFLQSPYSVTTPEG